MGGVSLLSKRGILETIISNYFEGYGLYEDAVCWVAKMGKLYI
jgi:hypothetical protein